MEWHGNWGVLELVCTFLTVVRSRSNLSPSEEVQQRVSRVSNARFQRAQDWLDGHMKMRKAIDEGFYVL